VTFWGLVQIFFDLLLIAATGFMWMRLNRPAKDDPRLSRGLQLLQSKIAVLEDLSDRTETQAGQLTALMEQKIRDLQAKLLQADKQIQKIDMSTSKSLEVAKIFQDKIPHQEIIERQNTIKYVKAARLAHQGRSVDDIAGQVDLSRGEIEFIAKVNREQLQFSEEDLPAWANQEAEESIVPVTAPIAPPPVSSSSSSLVSGAPPALSFEKTLSDLGAQFRAAVPRQMVEEEIASPAPSPAEVGAPPLAPKPNVSSAVRETTPAVRKVVFPRIDQMR
jgi:hypothetical protein